MIVYLPYYAIINSVIHSVTVLCITNNVSVDLVNIIIKDKRFCVFVCFAE